MFKLYTNKNVNIVDLLWGNVSGGIYPLVTHIDYMFSVPSDHVYRKSHFILEVVQLSSFLLSCLETMKWYISTYKLRHRLSDCWSDLAVVMWNKQTPTLIWNFCHCPIWHKTIQMWPHNGFDQPTPLVEMETASFFLQHRRPTWMLSYTISSQAEFWVPPAPYNNENISFI